MEAVPQLYKAEKMNHVAGDRHGNKICETLQSVEQLTNTEDLGTHYRVTVNIGYLNYSFGFEEGKMAQNVTEGVHASHPQIREQLSEVSP